MRNAWKGLRLTDDQLREVVSAYREKIETGSRKPTQEIADENETPRSTVARWLVEARKRGLLEPATIGSTSALAKVVTATERRKRCEVEWRETLRVATEEHSLRAVAVVAGISHARVSQIVGRKS